MFCVVQPVRRVDRPSVITQSERSRDVQSSSDIVTSRSVVHHVAHGNTAAVPPSGSVNVKYPLDKTVVHQPAVAAVGEAATRAAAAAVTGGPVKMSFPLSELFDTLIVCHVCFTDGKSPVSAAHNCQQDVLVVQYKQNGAWFRIRERTNHCEFAGKYHMCNQQPNYAIGKRCPRGDHCTFAHSEVERALWMAEKSGQFNIRQFISQSGSRSDVSARHTIQSVLATHPGHLAFLCRDCYLYSHRVSMQSSAKPNLCSVEVHDWSSSAVLAHCLLAGGKITLIGRYPEMAAEKDFVLCLMSMMCQQRWTGECTHAHSIVERDVWCVQRDCGLTQLQMIRQVSVCVCVCVCVCACVGHCV